MQIINHYLKKIEKPLSMCVSACLEASVCNKGYLVQLITPFSLTKYFYHFHFLTLTFFIQWLRLKVIFINSQSQPLRVFSK